jgi:hypothetical protein
VPGFWDRLLGRRRDAAVEREAEEEQMSPDERRFVDESVEDRQADEFVGEHLGGVDPARLLEEDEPPRER